MTREFLMASHFVVFLVGLYFVFTRWWGLIAVLPLAFYFGFGALYILHWG